MAKETRGETSKCREQRIAAGVYQRYFQGRGIDIGAGGDPLETDGDVVAWNEVDGDAQFMKGVKDGAFDFVYSSHALEHLIDPVRALTNWIRICKVGGFIYVAVPDFDLYEKRRMPSLFNKDHKFYFSLGDFDRVIKLPGWLDQFTNAEILECWLNDLNYDHSATRLRDQTKGKACAQIEFVLRRIK